MGEERVWRCVWGVQMTADLRTFTEQVPKATLVDVESVLFATSERAVKSTKGWVCLSCRAYDCVHVKRGRDLAEALRIKLEAPNGTQ